MIDRIELTTSNEASKENIEISNWAWNSHWWVEDYPGYCRCKWCKATHTSTTGINKDFPLCSENYAIKALLKKEKDNG